MICGCACNCAYLFDLVVGDWLLVVLLLVCLWLLVVSWIGVFGHILFVLLWFVILRIWFGGGVCYCF